MYVLFSRPMYCTLQWTNGTVHQTNVLYFYRPEEAVSTSGWETIREEIKSQAPPTKPDIEIDTKSLPLIDEEGGDKILHFYWLDVYEDYYRQPGTVYMFGKVWVEEAHTHVRYVM